jgi:hypothetical protein
MVPAPSLQELIGVVLADAPDEAPLSRLETAASVTKAVDETADAVLGYFVDQARRAGHSWSEIGESLGVSKQAAQQRHGPRLGPPFMSLERFTERARRVVAQSEFSARHLGHSFIGTEHFLLAQYAEPDGIGAHLLIEGGLSAEQVRMAIVERIGEGSGTAGGPLPYTPRAVQLVTDAQATALELGHNYVGTEHLLVASARGEGVAATVLADAGLDEATLRSRLTAKLAGTVPPTASSERSAASTRSRPRPGRSTKRPGRRA